MFWIFYHTLFSRKKFDAKLVILTLFTNLRWSGFHRQKSLFHSRRVSFDAPLEHRVICSSSGSHFATNKVTFWKTLCSQIHMFIGCTGFKILLLFCLGCSGYGSANVKDTCKEPYFFENRPKFRFWIESWQCYQKIATSFEVHVSQILGTKFLLTILTNILP